MTLESEIKYLESKIQSVEYDIKHNVNVNENKLKLPRLRYNLGKVKTE